MGALADKMKLTLELLGRSKHTVDAYLRYARKFVEFHRRSPEDMGEPEVQAWMEHLIVEKQAKAELLRVHIAAVKFLYIHVVGRPQVVNWLPSPKKRRKLPSVLSLGEVNRLIEAAPNLRSRAFIEAAYGGGLRISEICTLRIEDIDSKRGVLHLRDCKGSKDRIAPLPARLLTTLREYYRATRPGGPWLFPGRPKDHPIRRQSVYEEFRIALAAAGLTRQVKFHSLRHAFATHLLEEGVDIVTIKEMMGHAWMTSTQHYLHVRTDRILAVGSPLDRLPAT